MKKIKILNGLFILAFCFMQQFVFAQPVKDPNKTYGEGTTTNTSISTNPDSFIPERKTEYKDANGVTRQEDVESKDLDRNEVKKQKFYDSSGRLIKQTENRTDTTGKQVFIESKEFGRDGRVINASKFRREDHTFYYYDWDNQKQEYKNPSSFTLSMQNKPGSLPCPKDRFAFTLGYSYWAVKQTKFPVGVDLGVGARLNKSLCAKLDLSAHTSNNNQQDLLRLNALAGIEFDREKCDKPAISVFSRIAIGMIHDRIKNEGAKSTSGQAPLAAAGGGVRISINEKFFLQFKADALTVFYKGNMQIEYRAGIEFGIRSGKKTSLTKTPHLNEKN